MSDEHDDGLGMPLVEAMETQRAVRRLLPDPVDDDDRPARPRARHQGADRQQPSGLGVRGRARPRREAPARPAQPPGVVGVPAARRSAGAEATRAHAEDHRRGAVAGRPLRGGPGGRGRLPPRALARCSARRCSRSSCYGSIYPAVQNLLLAARAVGLGATLTTLPLWSTTLARRTLGLPATVTPVAVVPMGWPTGTLRSDHPQTGGRSGTSRPLRESTVPVSCCPRELHAPRLRLRQNEGTPGACRAPESDSSLLLQGR